MPVGRLPEEYVFSPTSASDQPAKPRSARVSRSERLRRARAFDAALRLRAWTNGMVARRLGVGPTYVRQLRAGDRALQRHHVISLGAVGTELLSLFGQS